MFRFALILSLIATPALAYDQQVQDLKKKFDSLPFELHFTAPDSNFGGRSGRHGRVLKPNEQMDFSPNRQPWEMGRDTGYPGPKLGLTFRF